MARAGKDRKLPAGNEQLANSRSVVTRGDFDAFYVKHLIPAISLLEVERKKVARRIWLWLLLIVPSGTALTWHLFETAANEFVVVTVFAGSVIGVIWVLTVLRVRYDRNFNSGIVKPIICFFDPSLDYTPDGCVAKTLFDQARFYEGAPPERYSGEDLVEGMLGKTRMCFSEITAQRVTLVKSKSGSDTERVTTLFKGVFFSADFNKFFSGATFVFPDRAEKLFGSIGQMLQSWHTEHGQIVKLEDPEFERAFVVYSNNQIEARYILTPALMQRLLDFRRRSKRKPQFSFVGSNLNIGLNRGGKLFESRLFRTLLKPSIYEAFWSDLTELAGIVEELNLNTRIWTKA